MTRIGMLFECGPDGADIKVCKHLAKMIQSDITIDAITLDNKPNLIQKCGDVTSLLLQDCERVLIIWDLCPPWDEEKACRHKDREAILQSLSKADLTAQQLLRVHLVCIEQELEAWLLADMRAINNFISNPNRPQPNIPVIRRPEQIPNPKKRLNQIIQEHTRKPYVDREHAEKIIRGLPDLKRLKRCSTFQRFAQKIKGEISAQEKKGTK
jgi:Domain of unknown function (DUF4276)